MKYKINNRTLEIIFSALLFLALFLTIVFAQEEKENEINGQKLYDGFCAPCHGYKGDGKGYASNFTFPKPRDFTSGIYKFRSTNSGEPPIDEDIIRSIKNGIPGTSMSPLGEKLNDKEIKAIVDYVKGFSEETFELPGEPIEIGEPPPATDEIIAKGKELFDKAKCWECHGKFGRGNGEKGWQEKFKDDWGDKIYPTNLTYSWEMRNGSSPEDIYRAITTGLDGTPMASYLDAYSDDDRWTLSHYVRSLQIERKFDGVLNLNKVKDIPSSTNNELWDKTDYIDIRMEGKKIFGEPFIPMITNVRVRGLYTGSEVAIMLGWTDKKPNKGGDGFPIDAVRLQFPVNIPSKKSYSYKDNKKNLINLWYWKASNNLVVEFNANTLRGKLLIKQGNSDVKAISDYSDGLYRVIFKRLLNTKDGKDVAFTTAEHIPFSIVAYDGQNNEEEDRGAISATYYIKLGSSILQ